MIDLSNCTPLGIHYNTWSKYGGKWHDFVKYFVNHSFIKNYICVLITVISQVPSRLFWFLCRHWSESLENSYIKTLNVRSPGKQLALQQIVTKSLYAQWWIKSSHVWPLFEWVYDPKRQNLEMFWTGKKKQLPKSPLELLPFELGHFRLNKELKKKKQMVNLNYMHSSHYILQS